MIRLVYLSKRWIGVEIDLVFDDVSNIIEFLKCDEPVLIATKDMLQEMGIEYELVKDLL